MTGNIITILKGYNTRAGKQFLCRNQSTSSIKNGRYSKMNLNFSLRSNSNEDIFTNFILLLVKYGKIRSAENSQQPR